MENYFNNRNKYRNGKVDVEKFKEYLLSDKDKTSVDFPEMFVNSSGNLIDHKDIREKLIQQIKDTFKDDNWG